MPDIGRTDRLIGAAVLAVLLALLGWGLAERPSSSHPGAVAPHRSAGTPAASVTPAGGRAGGPVRGTVTAIGDSTLLDSEPELRADLPGVRIEGQVNLQFHGGVQMVDQLHAAGALGDVLVVDLGTNGALSPADFDAMVQAAAGVTRIVFVNVNVPRPWAASVNAVLAAGVSGHPSIAVLADWDTLSAGHPSWFAPDQIHLEPAGAKALADLVAHDA